MGELQIGKATHYYSRIGVAALKLDAPLRKGDRIHILGSTTDIEQTVESMEIEHRQVANASPGDDVAIAVLDKVRDGDKVYRIVEDVSPLESRQAA